MSVLYTPDDLSESVTKSIRVALAISGVFALIFGVLILAWPDHTAMAMVAIFVILWAFVAAVTNLALAFFSRAVGGWSRVGYLALGVLFGIVGVAAWVNLGAVTKVLALVIGIIVGVVWIIEGVVVLVTALDGRAKPWPIIYAVISILAGVAVLSAPLWGVALLWLVLGVSLVIVGITGLIRSFRFGR